MSIFCLFMNKLVIVRWLLFPFSLMYGWVGWCRNKLYDWKVLKSTSFEGVQLIGVGNLSSGGTGKTPHVEYLVKQLKEDQKVAVLSRGYKRKTKGFVLATAECTAMDIGDEPMQMYRKFETDGVTVAVCENRVEGVRKLLQLKPGIEVIVLDDVFQHRRIEVNEMILLTDFNHLFTKDYVLPMGNLREFRKGYQRADWIVVTKCPKGLSEQRKAKIIEAIRPFSHQKVSFSFLKYGNLYSFSDNSLLLEWENIECVLVVCGIAKPERMMEYVSSKSENIDNLFFGDHHDFSLVDLEQIHAKFEALKGTLEHKFILTTEKDAVRLELWRGELKKMGLLEQIFVLGVEVGF